MAIDKEGCIYEGSWSQNNYHGFGRLIDLNNVISLGNWENGQFTGESERIWGHGSPYEEGLDSNELRELRMNIQPNKRTYTGQFKDGKMHGSGVLVWEHGTRFEGTFVDGKAEGSGILSSKTEIEYQGQLTNDQFTLERTSERAVARRSNPILEKM